MVESFTVPLYSSFSVSLCMPEMFPSVSKSTFFTTES